MMHSRAAICFMEDHKMAKKAIIVEIMLLFIFVFMLSLREKNVESSVVIMQIKIINEYKYPDKSLMINAR